jgi:hypothetical protein
MGATGGTGTGYSSGTPEFTPASHPWVETRISHTAKNRSCAVSLVRKTVLVESRHYHHLIKTFE